MVYAMSSMSFEHRWHTYVIQCEGMDGTRTLSSVRAWMAGYVIQCEGMDGREIVIQCESMDGRGHPVRGHGWQGDCCR